MSIRACQMNTSCLVVRLTACGRKGALGWVPHVVEQPAVCPGRSADAPPPPPRIFSSSLVVGGNEMGRRVCLETVVCYWGGGGGGRTVGAGCECLHPLSSSFSSTPTASALTTPALTNRVRLALVRWNTMSEHDRRRGSGVELEDQVCCRCCCCCCCFCCCCCCMEPY